MSGTLTKKEKRGSVSITDVANLADVSVATVSRVMNANGAVDPALKRKVNITSRKLGFSPKRVTPCLAIITGRQSPALPVGYVSVLTAMLSRLAAHRGVVAELIDIDNLDICLEPHISGAIGIVFDDRLLELTQVPNLPLVAINKPLADKGVHSFYSDHYHQSLEATNYLIQHGHQDIAFLAIEPDEWGSRERRRGYEDAMASANLQVTPNRIQYSVEQPLYETLARWKARGVTAILNFSEDAGLETLHILGNVLGLRLGQDISTISLEDLPIYQYMSPPQTVVWQPLETLAQLAIDRLLQVMSHDDGQISDICLETRLIERDSVARIPQT